ncbi:MAG: class I SAM-dependent methyltransferase [Deltaproteobacteria bacterium]|nr:class I SAM-dependent methyltransferase [Deltaproteobacteria bacterium]
MLTIDFRKLALEQGDFVLDAGCGEGRHVFACVRHNCQVYGLDFDTRSLLKARYVLDQMKKRHEERGRVILLRGDTLRFPFPDQTFQKIVCSEVIEHVVDDREGVKELARVLKDGGKLAVSVPTRFTEHLYDLLSKEYFRTPGGHIRKVHPRNLAQSLEENGLRVYAVGFAHAFHSPYWMLRCIFGLHDEKARIPRFYRRLLHLALFSKPLRFAEKVCNYFFPKSIILYAQKIGKVHSA